MKSFKILPLALALLCSASFSFAGKINCVTAEEAAILSSSITCDIHIETAQEFASLADSIARCTEICADVVQNIYLDNDITLTDKTLDASCAATAFNPISNFSGNLNGQGYTISGLCLKAENSGDTVALFKSSYGNVNIQNVNIQNAYVSGNNSNLIALFTANHAGDISFEKVSVKDITITSGNTDNFSVYAAGLLLAYASEGNISIRNVQTESLKFDLQDVENAGGLVGIKGVNESYQTQLTMDYLEIDVQMNISYSSSEATTDAKVIPEIKIGALIGNASQMTNIQNVSLTHDIQLNTTSNQYAEYVGGFIGLAASLEQYLETATYYDSLFVYNSKAIGKISIAKEQTIEQSTLHLGGLIGESQIQTNIRNSSYRGAVTAKQIPGMSKIGALVGYINPAIPGNSISSITESFAQATNDTLISVFVNSAFNAETDVVLIGGLAGEMNQNVESYENVIENSYVHGGIYYTDAVNSNFKANVASLIAADNYFTSGDATSYVNVLNTYFNGKIQADNASIYVLHSSQPISLVNHYSYERSGALQSFVPESTDLTQSIFNNVAITSKPKSDLFITSILSNTTLDTTDGTYAVATPGFAETMNSYSRDESWWFYDPKNNEGLPQLTAFANDYSILPTVSVAFYEQDESGSPKTLQKAFTNKNGKLAYAGDGSLFDISTLPQKLNFNADSTAATFYRDNDTTYGMPVYWNDNATEIFTKNYTFQKLTVPQKVVQFVVQNKLVETEMEFMPIEESPETYYGVFNSYNMFEDDSLPTAAFYYQEEGYDFGEFVKTNRWFLINESGKIYGEAISSFDLMMLVLDNPQYTADTLSLALMPSYMNDFPPEYYQTGIGLKSEFESASLQLSVLGTPLDTVISADDNFEIYVPNPNQITIQSVQTVDGAAVDSLLLIIGNATFTVAVGEAFDFKEHGFSIEALPNIQIAPKIVYSIAYDFGEYKNLFHAFEYPTEYYKYQTRVNLPSIASLDACGLEFEITGQNKGSVDQDSTGWYWYAMDYSSDAGIAVTGDITFSVFKNPQTPCSVTPAEIMVSADSNVTVTLSHFGDTLLSVDGKYLVPQFDPLYSVNVEAHPELVSVPLSISAQSSNDLYSVDSILWNNTIIKNPGTILVRASGTIHVYASDKTKLPTEMPTDSIERGKPQIARAEAVLSGNAARIYVEFATNSADSSENLFAEIRIKNTNDNYPQNPTFKKVVKDSIVSFDYYPLPAGTYEAEIRLFKKELAFDVPLAQLLDSTTISWSIQLPQFASDNWEMISLAGLDTSAFKIEDNEEVTFYTWDETNPIGEYWQYKRLVSEKDIQPTTGYWMFAEDSVQIPLTNAFTPLNAEAIDSMATDSIHWKLLDNYSGWNMVSNPYPWKIYIGSSNFSNPENEEMPLWHWNPTYAEYEPIDTLGAYAAVWAYSTESKTKKSIRATPVFPTAFSDETTKDTLTQKAVLTKQSSENSWALRLKMVGDNGNADSWNIIGVAGKEISVTEPPKSLKSDLTLSIVGEHGALAKSIRRASNQLKWELSMSAEHADKAKLYLEGFENLQKLGYRAFLIQNDNIQEYKTNEGLSVHLTQVAQKAELHISKTIPTIAFSGIQNLQYSIADNHLNVQFEVSEKSAGKYAEINIVDIRGQTHSYTTLLTVSGINKTALSIPSNTGVLFLNLSVGNNMKRLRVR